MSLENTVSSEENEDFVDELKPDTELMHGQYTIEGFLAAGGFGITYLARDSLQRRVVVKECFPGNFCRRQNASVMPRSRAHQTELKSIVDMFSQEAMSLAKANHPNIVGVHQVFEENNTAYMALDFVQGRDLLEILTEDPNSLTPDSVVGYLTKVLGAIQHIHDLGMLHRDISPDNIIINEDGEPILIDFGAAREESSTDERVTRMLSAMRVVKDGYSPQEFYISGSTQTPSCDLYSLAASFYHIITGELPPDSQSRLSAKAADEPDPYVSLGEKVSGYSKNFVSALDKAMEILPPDRMQSANEWLSHMNNAEPVTPKKLTSSNSRQVATKSETPYVPVLIGVGALAAAGIGFLVLSNGTEPDATANVEAPALAEVETVATDVDALPTPAGQDSAPAAISAEQDAPQVQIGRDLEVATVNVEDTPTFEPIERVTAPVETSTSSLDFFVSMNASEPALTATPSTRITATPRPQILDRPSVVDDAPRDNSSIITKFLPKPPFLLSTSEQGLIVAVSIDAPNWLEENVRIGSIDGQLVETNEQITERLAEIASQSDAGDFEAVIEFERQDGSTFERSISIPTERQTLLLNGLIFVTREDGSTWTTTVVEAPETSNLNVGDTLMSYVGNWEEVNGPNSLQNIINRELANGTSNFSFVVQRDGESWVETFELAS